MQKQLTHWMNSDRIPHAMLFSGKAGHGPLAAGLLLSQFILCENKSEQGPCQECSACHKVSRNVHPDLHFSFPFVSSSSAQTSDDFLPSWRQRISEHPYFDYQDWMDFNQVENKRGNINVKECEAIIRKFALKPFEGENKVMIIWLAEYLGKEGNKLLKLIEEPPPNSYLILITENVDRVLNTILSRCQAFRFPPIPAQEIQAHLEEQGVSDEKAKQIAFLVDGDMNQALKLKEETLQNQADDLLNWLRACYTAKPDDLIKWIDNFAKWGRDKQRFFLQYALQFLRQLNLLNYLPEDQVRLDQNELETAYKMKKIISFQKLSSIVNLLNETTAAIERNAHPKILLMGASMDVHDLITKREAVV